MVIIMSVYSFSEVKDWDKFNSSLLIEVTRPNGVFTCTGVAISPEVIVTAAHCLEGRVDKVRVFTQSVYDPTQTFLEIKNYMVHPHYNPSKSRYRSDIAKINMKDTIPAFVNIHQVQKTPRIMGQIYRFGFGERDKKNLRTVVTPNFRRVNLEEGVIELDDEFSRAGDSGGPIFIQNGDEIFVLAIHSTFSHGPEGNFSMNPLLSPFMPWLLGH